MILSLFVNCFLFSILLKLLSEIIEKKREYFWALLVKNSAVNDIKQENYLFLKTIVFEHSPGSENPNNEKADRTEPDNTVSANQQQGGVFQTIKGQEGGGGEDQGCHC